MPPRMRSSIGRSRGVASFSASDCVAAEWYVATMGPTAARTASME